MDDKFRPPTLKPWRSASAHANEMLEVALVDEDGHAVSMSDAIAQVTPR